MSYNLTFAENMTDPVALYQGVNTLAGGFFFVIIMVALYMLVFMASKEENFAKNLLVGSFLNVIVAGALYAAGLLPASFLFVPVGTLILSLAMLVWGEQ